MACFLVPLAEGIAVSAVKKIALKGKKDCGSAIREKIGSLEKMLYGGSFFLALEHVYHGEVVFYPPFLTAMKSPEETAEMLHEMATVGVAMAVFVTLVWGFLQFVIKKRNEADSQHEKWRFGKAILNVALGTVVMFVTDGLFALLA